MSTRVPRAVWRLSIIDHDAGPPQTPPRHRVAGYRIEERIGRGGMGVVYLRRST